MEEKEKKLQEIPSEKFAFVNTDAKLHDEKFETKPIGYFKDAMRRFRKNRGSVVAGVIILFLVLFALLVPLTSSYVAKNVRVSEYSKMGPRTTWGYNIGINGSENKEYNDLILLKNYGIGVAAEYRYDEATNTEHHATFEEGKNSAYQPIIKQGSGYESRMGANVSYYYKANIDTYLGVGFQYYELNNAQYTKLLNWQNETGIQVLYPMIDTTHPDYFDCGDEKIAPNYWYRASSDRNSKGAPLTSTGAVQRLKTDNNIEYNDIYLRKDGKVQFFIRVGGGTTETASYKVRVLYYNYYQYLYGVEPNYIFGTDSQGYDLAYRMATGMRLSFALAVLVSVINFIIGAIYGAIEGYYGGATDLIMERITDILVEVPFVVVATLFQLHFSDKVGAFPSLIFAFILTGWIGTASRVRSQFYRFKNNEYVLAARTLGARDARIMWKHIFPNTLGTIITSSVLVIPGVIFSESMLSYLGIIQLGTKTSTSLGTLLSEASGLWQTYPHLMIFPAIVISLLMICFNLFGNGLRDAFNPTLRGADE
ncbi:MAG: ABC transporter permease [Bacilli bacterium]|nr:ABC transporter permease [Bacilli bacterium]